MPLGVRGMRGEEEEGKEEGGGGTGGKRQVVEQSSELVRGKTLASVIINKPGCFNY